MKKLFIVFSLVGALISVMALNSEALTISGAISFSGTSIQDNLDSTYDTISMHGSGIAHTTGFDGTPGNLYFSANSAGRSAGFPALVDVSAVSEPATMLLLGLGLVGVGAFARRKLRNFRNYL